ncbi:hypothetical protein [Maritalea myrionectae]|uniref:hypothetical protein n=1 Tax=Maritalea myrionectae TaxID=454601 RepID=UPI000483149B|nr:hypothetical protein [Maritalea myrionectae]
MFWKRKNKSAEPEIITTKVTPMPEKSASERMMDSAEIIATELRNYEQEALNLEKTEPDAELLEAQEKLEAARKIVRDGRLAYALVRQLVDHIMHWSSWVKMDDFQKYVHFDAKNVSASRTKSEGESGNINTDTISFTFEGSKYCCVIHDQGYSSAPDSAYKFGEVEFWANEKLALKLSMVEDYSNEYSRWEFSDVMAFHSGKWMTALLKISSQIEQRQQEGVDKFSDDRVKEAGANINLDSDS